MPAVPNVAVGETAVALEKPTVPGPETFDHVYVRAWPSGSDEPEAERLATDEREVDWSGPALAIGVRLVFVTAILTASESVPPFPSETEKVTEYDPL